MSLTLMQIVEDAYEQVGRPPDTLTARDLETARRSLEVLFARWANDDVNIWKISDGTSAITSAASSVTIGTSLSPIVDVLNVSLRDSNNYDIQLEPISQADYQRLPNKTQQNKPTQYATFKNTVGVTLKLYPHPNTTYTLIYHTINYVTPPTGFDSDLDLPRRFKPALISGLAHLLAMKNQMKIGPNNEVIQDGVTPQHTALLLREYTTVYGQAKDADRERTPFYAIPYVR